MSLEEYIIKKLDARIDALGRELKELSVRVKKAEQRLNSIDDGYVSTVWFDAVLTKLHPEIEEDGWYEDV